MTHIDVLSSTLKKVKEIVDFIYDVTGGEGSTGGWGSYSSRTQIIVQIMVSRGILKRSGPKPRPHYIWAANMAPTSALYKSIAEDMVRKERESVKKHYAAKQLVVEKPDVACVKQESKPSLDSFTSQELWDELKRRGYDIEDCRLVVVRKEYLN